MIQDLKSDSQRWQQERENRAGRGGSPHVRDTAVSKQPNAAVVAYQDSQTHASRQHWGPSESFSQSQQPARTSQHSATHYVTSDHYTTAPAPSSAYGQQPAGYAATPSSYTQPRTQPVVDPYAGYAQAPREHPSYTPTQQYGGYAPQPVVQDPYRSQPPPPSHAYAAPRYFGYFPNGYLVYR